LAAKSFPQILVESAVISPQQLSQAQTRLPQFANRISSTIIQMGFTDSETIAQLIAQNYGLPIVDLSAVEINKDLTRLIKRSFCDKFFVVPLIKSDKGITFAFSDPNVLFYKNNMESILGVKIDLVVAKEEEVREALDRAYAPVSPMTQTHIDSSNSTPTAAKNQSASVAKGIQLQGNENSVQFIDKVIGDAIANKASDIHFEQFESRFRVRFRIDGQMIEVLNVPGLSATEVVSRVKVMAKMDVSEKRHPQDGRIKFKFREDYYDMRVNVLPTLFGEKVVMRILDKKNLNQNLSSLGMNPLHTKIFRNALSKSQGMILVTGPTGSGKTTTLYSGLMELNAIAKNISTAEDPVEFNLDGINQVQVNSDIGFTFAEALRAFLRQDPDVIMIGEIRDLETANMSYKAASTGHLVLSTLHTNDAISAVSRLIDMGVPKFLVAETTTLVTAQRLIKKLCTQCRVSKTPSPQYLLDLGVPESELELYEKVYEERGCASCNNTGYKGRVAIHEMLEMNSTIRESIIKGSSMQEIKNKAMETGFITLRMQALLKLREGLISLTEVVNSTLSDKDQ
jgi:type IV pilus assembly protein PilB